MTVKNQEVAQAFADGQTHIYKGYKEVEAKAKNLFIDGNAIYSYGYHFPIAYKLEDGTAFFNADGYSNSTARHKGYVRRAIQDYFKIVLVSTEKLKDIISKGIKTKEELVLNEL